MSAVMFCGLKRDIGANSVGEFVFVFRCRNTLCRSIMSLKNDLSDVRHVPGWMLLQCI